MATEKLDNYADYKYVIHNNAELREAKWLVEQGDFTDLDDYIECARKAAIRIMKREDIAKKKRADARKKRLIGANTKRHAA